MDNSSIALPVVRRVLSEVLKIGISRMQERALVGVGSDGERKIILAKPQT